MKLCLLSVLLLSSLANSIFISDNTQEDPAFASLPPSVDIANAHLVRYEQQEVPQDPQDPTPNDSCDVSPFKDSDNSEICSFIQTHCSPTIFSLSQRYYCSTTKATKISLLIVSSLLLLLYFLTFALLTQHFLYPNLSLLAQYLHISPKIAGLTLLALGNATPDVFSTYSAMAHNSAPLALGELVGAANFVICVVIGGMGILKPFDVDPDRFGWDLCMFGTLVGLAFWFIGDGKLRNWECVFMVVGYVAYVSYQVLMSTKELEEEDEEVIDHTDHQQLLEEGLLPVHSAHTDNVSIKSLDSNQSRGLQPVSLLDAQRIWLAHKRLDDHDDSETGPLLTRPNMARTFRSTENINYLSEGNKSLPKSASADHLNFLGKQPSSSSSTTKVPVIVIEAAEIETPPLAAQQEPTIHELTTAPKEGPWWVYLLSPMVIDEPKTVFTIISLPIVIILNILNPVYYEHLHQYPEYHSMEISFKSKLFKLQLSLLPFFFTFMVSDTPNYLHSTIVAILLLLASSYIPNTILIPVLGFLTSILLILLTSSHLIILLKNLGVVLHMPESLLGLTILAIGNSTGDLVSNLTLAGLDMGMVGLNACLGSPLLYILFGIGLNGLVINLMNGQTRMKLEMDDNFKISGGGLMCMLLFYAIVVPMKGWRIDRAVGCVGVCWWCLVTGFNVYVSMRY